MTNRGLAQVVADVTVGEPATKKEPKAQKDAKVGPTDAAEKVNDGQVIGFRQAEVAAQMTELEERMYRLSEALRQMEPENSSRLMLGLKFAREELILHQMRETQQLLEKLSLGEAVVEQKNLVSKLQRLHDMLLSSDLDLQMRLEQVRQLREILRRLDKAIVEEDRERKQSIDAAGRENKVEALGSLRTSLEILIKREKSHIEAAKPLAAIEAPTDEQATKIAQLADEQKATHTNAQKLAAAAQADGATLAHLEKAMAEMAESIHSLEGKQLVDAAPHQQVALESLMQQLRELTKEIDGLSAELNVERFTAWQKDQAGNRQFTDGISDSVRNVGDLGAAALGSLQSATGSMTGAEKELGMHHAEPASQEQSGASEALKMARNQLSLELDKLLDKVRAEVKRRVLEDITLMLEKQIAVRESSTVLGARVKSGGRQILASIVALANSEQKIVSVADELIGLVEETEFGIALPAALTMVRDSMAEVRESLAAADASESLVNREREIEDDLKELLVAMKRLPASSASPADSQDPNRARERELNRLVAELRMIRLLQIRVNRSTNDTEARRSADLETLSADLRRQIENVTNQQDDVRDVTERLFLIRAEELPE